MPSNTIQRLLIFFKLYKRMLMKRYEYPFKRSFYITMQFVLLSLAQEHRHGRVLEVADS